MSDDDVANDAFAENDGASTVKAGKLTGRRASRSLRRARDLYEGSDWQPSTEAEFRLREATVLAMIDLAEAIREQSRERA